MRLISLEPDWAFVADTVMGGVSIGQITQENVSGRSATRLTGQVSLDNNGGFVQMAFNLGLDGLDFDASDYEGVEIDVIGNGEIYDVRMRTSGLPRPWQSYRNSFTAGPVWSTIKLPFAEFAPHKVETPIDIRRLRRIGILGIGREFDADVAVSAVRLRGRAGG